MPSLQAGLRQVFQAPTRESEKTNLLKLNETWGDEYAIAIRSWQIHRDELVTYFEYPAEIRRLIYTTDSVGNYHRQLCKVTKIKSIFPASEAARKLLYLAYRNILKAHSQLAIDPQPTSDPS